MSDQNFAGSPPFANNGPVPAPPTQAAPVAPAAPTQAAPVQTAAPKEKRPQPKTPDNAVQFIVSNIKTMSYAEIGTALSTPGNEIQARDVNNIIQRIKKMMRDSAGKEGYATKQVTSKKSGKVSTKQDYNNPLTEQAKKVETWIAANLARPAEAKVGAPGGTRKESAMNQALQGDINSILASL